MIFRKGDKNGKEREVWVGWYIQIKDLRVKNQVAFVGKMEIYVSALKGNHGFAYDVPFFSRVEAVEELKKIKVSTKIDKFKKYKIVPSTITIK